MGLYQHTVSLPDAFGRQRLGGLRQDQLLHQPRVAQCRQHRRQVAPHVAVRRPQGRGHRDAVGAEGQGVGKTEPRGVGGCFWSKWEPFSFRKICTETLIKTRSTK